MGVCVCACARVCLRACVCVCVCARISSSLHSVCFWQLLLCAHKRIVNIMKVYIERNNMQVELKRFRKHIDFIDVGNFEVDSFATDVFTLGKSFQHMPVR